MAAGFILRAALFAAIYLACAGASSRAEWGAAALTGIAGATLAILLGRSGRSYAARLGDFVRHAPGVAAAILRDAARLTAAFAGLALGRRIAGEVVARPFDLGAGTPEARSRRGIVIAAVALAPNTVPVAIDYKEATLLVRRLLPGPEPADPRWPL